MNIWDEWRAEHTPKKEPQRPKEQPTHEMSGHTAGDYLAMLEGLDGVTFLPGSYDKRFCRDISGVAHDAPKTPLTMKQALLIEVMYHRYRRQIPNHKKLCNICKAE